MEKLRQYHIGNSRLIYKKSSINDLNAVDCWSFIDEFIDKNPKLSKASNSGYIYFLDARANECFVGKEIIGFCDSNFLSDFELESMDLNSSEIFSYSYQGDLSVEALLEKEEAIRREVDYLARWRVRISDDSEQLIHLEFWKS